MVSILALLLVVFSFVTIFLTMLVCWVLIAASRARHRRNPYEFPETLL